MLGPSCVKAGQKFSISFANQLENMLKCQQSSWYYLKPGGGPGSGSQAKFESPFDVKGNMPAFLIAPSEPQDLIVDFRCQNGQKATNSGMSLNIKVI
jgi:hypothetical protein